MANIKITNLLNTFHLDSDPDAHDKIDCQEVVDYCEARFRVILQTILECTIDDQRWMVRVLFRELVFVFFHTELEN